MRNEICRELRYLRHSLPLGVMFFTSCVGINEKTTKAPNVLLIYADDIGYGDLSCNGTSAVVTPNVEKLASEGIRFTNVHSGAATSTPSRYAMLTGEYAWRRPGTGIAAGDAAMVITPERYTLADMFKQAGYETAVVGKWHLGLGLESGKQNWNDTIRPNPADLGFDYSYIMAATADRVPCIFMENGKGVNLDTEDPISVSYTHNFPGEPTAKENPELLTLLPSKGHNQSIVNGIPRIGYMKGGNKARWKDENIADSITAHAIQFIEKSQSSGRPFFLYLATNDIHVPRIPHTRFIGKSGMGARGDAILSFDYVVGEMLNTLSRLHLDENTIVILSSDNGPVVDDGYQDQAAELLGDHLPSGIYRGGKYTLYEGGSCVPCILRWKGTVRPGVSESLLSQIDWLSSFASLLNVDMKGHTDLDSQNHIKAWLHASKNGRSWLVEQDSHNHLSLIQNGWKYFPAHGKEKEKLFHLTVDPGESNNLIRQEGKRASHMKTILVDVVESGAHYFHL